MKNYSAILLTKKECLLNQQKIWRVATANVVTQRRQLSHPTDRRRYVQFFWDSINQSPWNVYRCRLPESEIPGKQAFVPSENKRSANLKGDIWELKSGKKCIYAKLLRALGHRWWCLGGIQLTVGGITGGFKERVTRWERRGLSQLATPMRYKSRKELERLITLSSHEMRFCFTVQQSRRDSPSYGMGVRWMASTFWSHSQWPETTTVCIISCQPMTHCTVSADLAGLSYISGISWLSD